MDASRGAHGDASSARACGRKMPQFFAIATAVSRLSPVTILTSMPRGHVLDLSWAWRGDAAPSQPQRVGACAIAPLDGPRHLGAQRVSDAGEGEQREAGLRDVSRGAVRVCHRGVGRLELLGRGGLDAGQVAICERDGAVRLARKGAHHSLHQLLPLGVGQRRRLAARREHRVAARDDDLARALAVDAVAASRQRHRPAHHLALGREHEGLAYARVPAVKRRS